MRSIVDSDCQSAQGWRVRNGSAFDEREAVESRGDRTLPLIFALMCVRLRSPEIFRYLTQPTILFGSILLDSIAGSHARCKTCMGRKGSNGPDQKAAVVADSDVRPDYLRVRFTSWERIRLVLSDIRGQS
jgi:hypothetical protein